MLQDIFLWGVHDSAAILVRFCNSKFITCRYVFTLLVAGIRTSSHKTSMAHICYRYSGICCMLFFAQVSRVNYKDFKIICKYFQVKELSSLAGYWDQSSAFQNQMLHLRYSSDCVFRIMRLLLSFFKKGNYKYFFKCGSVLSWPA